MALPIGFTTTFSVTGRYGSRSSARAHAGNSATAAAPMSEYGTRDVVGSGGCSNK